MRSEATERKFSSLRVVREPSSGHASDGQAAEPLCSLVAGLAHDLNNQLAAMQGHLELLGTTRPERVAEHLNAAETAVQRSSVIIRRLLTLTRHPRERVTPMDVNAIVTSCVHAARRHAAPGVQLTLDLDPLAAPVFGIRDLLVLAVQELLARACKPARGAAAVFVRTSNVFLDDSDRVERPWVRPGAYLRLEIRDGGPPLTHDATKHFFDPAYADSLGVSTACAVVKQLHGFIDAVSDPGGTTIRVELPVV
jgi:signal transduction histidine kinase